MTTTQERSLPLIRVLTHLQQARQGLFVGCTIAGTQARIMADCSMVTYDELTCNIGSCTALRILIGFLTNAVVDKVSVLSNSIKETSANHKYPRLRIGPYILLFPLHKRHTSCYISLQYNFNSYRILFHKKKVLILNLTWNLIQKPE